MFFPAPLLALKRSLALFSVCLFGFLPIRTALAGSLDTGKSSPAPVEQPDTVFRQGALDLQVVSGVLFSVQRTTFLRPNLDYDLGVVRLGYMLDNVYGSGLLRGNDEFMLEAAGGSIFVGPGTGLGGLSLIYRRNFLYPAVQMRLVPYFQLGGGGAYSDAYHTHPQRVLGSPGEFDLQGDVGLHFRFTRRWSLDAEFDFRHLSNADLAGRNYGTNDIGALVGVSCSF